MVVGGWIGDHSLTILDDRARPIRYVRGTVTPDALAACPGGKRIVVLGSYQDSTGNADRVAFEVIDVEDGTVVRRDEVVGAEVDDARDRWPWAIECGDPAGAQIILAHPFSGDGPERQISVTKGEGVTVIAGGVDAVWHHATKQMAVLHGSDRPVLSMVRGGDGAVTSTTDLGVDGTAASIAASPYSSLVGATVRTPTDRSPSTLAYRSSTLIRVDASASPAPAVVDRMSIPFVPFVVNPDGTVGTSVPGPAYGQPWGGIEQPPSGWAPVATTAARPRGSLELRVARQLEADPPAATNSILRWHGRDGSAGFEVVTGVRVLSVLALPDPATVGPIFHDRFWPAVEPSATASPPRFLRETDLDERLESGNPVGVDGVDAIRIGLVVGGVGTITAVFLARRRFRRRRSLGAIEARAADGS